MKNAINARGDIIITLGYALCGSFCTLDKALSIMKKLADEGFDIVPIASFNTYNIDTRFGRAQAFMESAREICKKEVIHTIESAEPLGPEEILDALVVSPCTGNTLAKIAHGITDTPVTMAVKAQLRGNRPVIIALATNDALSANLENIGRLLERKHVYFVPMNQDDTLNKPHSMVADFDLLPRALAAALEGRQLRPLIN